MGKKAELFAILQKYEFSSKSQLFCALHFAAPCCLRYCKSTSFQANHNPVRPGLPIHWVVCDTAKVRVFKQITTCLCPEISEDKLFAILQKYEFSSKSQLLEQNILSGNSCLRYCKSMIFQANHKWLSLSTYGEWWCFLPSPPAVGHGRCVGYLFGAYYLFLLKCLVDGNKFVSLQWYRRAGLPSSEPTITLGWISLTFCFTPVRQQLILPVIQVWHDSFRFVKGNR